MDSEFWQSILVAVLALNALLGFAYRVYRWTKGGPVSDVIGQAILGGLLLLCAFGVAATSSWAQWAALAYGLLFGIVVMPVWTLAVLIPLPPGKVDYTFTGLYWVTLLGIAAAALLM